MKCLSDSLLAAFTEGLATADEIEEVEAHVAECADCRGLVAQLAASAPAAPVSGRTLMGFDEAADDDPPLLEEIAPDDADDLAFANPGALAEGVVLAGRYRIARFVSKGGMGEVYAAEDLELRETIALKIPKRGPISDEELLERLKREVQLARRVTHPNVCRMFDVGFHKGDDHATVFLTMELLEGETLEARLRRVGKLTPEEARPIIEQLVAGLAAAHERGVIHRDFKSNNVLLCADDRPGAGERAVIIDFGLARSEAQSQIFSLLSGTRAVVGTPPYLAPEMLEGQPASVASDLYSFGVVLFEMLVGRMPFLGETPQAAAMRRLYEPAPSPRSLEPMVSIEWDAAISRCLAREPEARFADARSLAEALGSSHPLPRAPASITLKRGLYAGAALVAAVLAVRLFVWALEPAPRRPPPLRRSLAIVDTAPVHDETNGAWPSVAVAELLRNGLSPDGDLRLPSGDASDQAAVGLRALSTAPPDERTVHALLRRLAVERLLLISTSTPADTPGRVHVEAALWTREPGHPPEQLVEDGALHELTSLSRRLATRVRATLGLPALAKPGSEGAPPSVAQLRLYAEGVQAHRRADEAGAAERWGRALKAGPADPMIDAALSAALERLGYREAAHRAMARAVEGADASPSLRRELEAGSYRIARAWDRVAATCRTSLDAHPDDAAAGLLLAEAEGALGDVTSAYQAIAALRALPDGARPETALDLGEARVGLLVGDWERAGGAARAAAARARAEGSLALASDARRLESAALLAQDSQKPALEAATDALDLARQAEDVARELDALLSRALAESRLGELDRARDTLEEVLRLATPRRQSEQAARALLNLAVIARRARQPDESKRRLDQWSALRASYASRAWP